MTCEEIKTHYKLLSRKSKSLVSSAYENQFQLSSNSFQFKMTYEKFVAEERGWLTEYFDVLKAKNILSARAAGLAHVQSIQPTSAR